MHLRGLAKSSLLETYDAERRPIVQKVIDNDKTISTLISGQYPPNFASRKEAPRDLLTEWYSSGSMQAFTLGLAISYPPTELSLENTGWPRATAMAGERGPDIYLTRLGTGDPIRLHSIMPNLGHFHISILPAFPNSLEPRWLT